METVAIGGMAVGRVGLGCYPLTGAYGHAEPAEGVRIIRAALDLGVNLLDTANIYGAGENERLLGRALRGRRGDAVVATKFGWLLDDLGKPVRLDSSPRQVRKSCEESLLRLQTDHLDLFQQHRLDPLTPVAETIAEASRLIEEGKIRAYGLSEVGPSTIAAANSRHPMASLQTEYSLWSRSPERRLLPLCERLGITFIAYSPLGRGLLAGGVRSVDDLAAADARRSQPRFQGENLSRNVALVRELTPVAASLGCTLAQLSLAWVLSRSASIVAIPGSRVLAHLEENVAASAVRLQQADLDKISAAFSLRAVHGLRQPAENMKTIEE